MIEIIIGVLLMALGFCAGIIVANKTNREVLKAIYRGKAYPDENGNVGWDIP